MLVPPPLSLYVHLPWCVRKCPYCDFNSHEFRGAGAPPFAQYVEALLADLDFDLPLAEGRTVHSVFFGGGTPSLFPPDAIDAFLQGASARLRFAPDVEVTLETNPGTAEHGRFELYRAAGVNRLSFGVQTFDDETLKRLGRIHDSTEAETAVKLAQDAGYGNFNLDLMYALPGQDLAMAERDIERALALQPAHVSHYQLTLEPNTAFAARPPPDIPDEDAAWDMQERCQAMLADAGYAQYEVSAYARPGMQCAHNLNYWRFGDYLGIGAGAHGKLSMPDANAPAGPACDASGADTRRTGSPAPDRATLRPQPRIPMPPASGTILRRWKHKHPAAWLARAGTAGAVGGDERIEPARRPFEYMLNALRLVEGFELSQFEARAGLPRAAIGDALDDARARGWLAIDGDRVRPTPLGRRFNNDAIALFL